MGNVELTGRRRKRTGEINTIAYDSIIASPNHYYHYEYPRVYASDRDISL